jgi:Spy/CpxP family protein refolding chaperone
VALLPNLYTFADDQHNGFTQREQNQIMRNTFTKFVLAAAITLLPALSYAQPPGGGRGGDPEQMIARQMTAMKEAVGLTEDQEKAIKPILVEQMKKQREMMEAGPSDDMREKMMAMRQESNAKIKKVLKEDQIEKFDKYQSQMRGRRGPGGPGGPPPPPQN